MDFSFLQNAAFWTGLVGVAGVVTAFITGRSTARKTDAEARKIDTEAGLLTAKEMQTAEERLHDRAMGAMTKLAEMYERNLETMQKTLDQMENEVEELRRENLKLQSTVEVLTNDNARLSGLVAELQTHVQTLIVALRQTKHELPHIAEMLARIEEAPAGHGVNSSTEQG